MTRACWKRPLPVHSEPTERGDLNKDACLEPMVSWKVRLTHVEDAITDVQAVSGNQMKPRAVSHLSRVAHQGLASPGQQPVYVHPLRKMGTNLDSCLRSVRCHNATAHGTRIGNRPGGVQRRLSVPLGDDQSMSILSALTTPHNSKTPPNAARTCRLAQKLLDILDPLQPLFLIRHHAQRSSTLYTSQHCCLSQNGGKRIEHT